MKHTVHHLELNNGAKGLLIDVPDATVMGFTLNFRAGDFLSPKGKWETAHVLEHMVLGANKEYPRARKFQAEFQKNGSYMNASTGPYDLNYLAECADFEWDRILKLLKLSIDSPLLKQDEFSAEMGNVREELTSDLNQNFRQIIIRARERFGLTALNDSERLKQMNNITVQDVKQHYNKTHVLGNLRFIVAGTIGARRDHILKTFEQLELQSGQRFDLPDARPKKYGQVFYYDKPGLENIYFYFSTFTDKIFNQRQDDAIGLVNTMLTATMHSRILGEAREKGLAYDIASSYNKFKNGTAWWFGAELMPQNTQPVFEIIKKEVKRLQDGKINAADIEAAKQYALGRYQRSAQTVNGVMSGYSGGYFFDERINDYYAVPDRIKQITKGDMIEAVRTLFADDTWGLAIMGTKKKTLANQLNRQLAPLWD